MSESIKGTVIEWNRTKGFGIILGEDENTYFAHYSGFKENVRRRIYPEQGQEVTFQPGRDQERQGRRSAINIDYDARSALLRFAYFPNFEEHIAELDSRVHPKESWSSHTFNEEQERESVEHQATESDWFSQEREKMQAKSAHPVSDKDIENRVAERKLRVLRRKKYPVLISHLERTFERLQLENKVVTYKSGAVFNTGLGDKYDGDIFAIFKINRMRDGLVFDGFTTAQVVNQRFGKPPEPANYFIDPKTGEAIPSDHFILNYKFDLIPADHILDDRLGRFPESWQSREDFDYMRHELNMLIGYSKQRVRRNFRAAVPFYYPSHQAVQMLLPLTFNPGAAAQETRALIVSLEQNEEGNYYYKAATPIPLEWAYKNARLIARPDRTDWLNF